MRPFWVMCTLTGAWAGCVGLGVVLPRYYVSAHHSGWDGIAAFLGWMMGAAVLAVAAMIALVVLFRQLGPWGRVIGAAPATIMAATGSYLVFAMP